MLNTRHHLPSLVALVLALIARPTGRARVAVGRRGPGPGEFGDYGVTFFDPSSRPLLVEFGDERIVALDGQKLPFLVRQAQLKQPDDSACVYLPLNQEEFAIISPNAPPVTGVHIESLPEAREAVIGSSRRRVHSLAEGTRSGASDVAAWRDMILVACWETSPHRRRVIDVYDRCALTYRGSVSFPFRIDHLAVHGDTLAVTGEVDDEPVVGVFLSGRRGGVAR